MQNGLDLALIGNCHVSALVNPQARIVWWCYPRFDSNPVFCRLLAGGEEKGFSDVVLHGMVDCTSSYARNSAVVETVMTDAAGASIRVVDFAPRYQNFGRVTRPPQLMRIVEPLSGMPRITIRMRPCNEYGRPVSRWSAGSNHITYWGEDTSVRLTTDAPLSYIEKETEFVLTRPVYLVFGADEPFPTNLADACTDVLKRTLDYWAGWVRGLSVSYDWQDAVIRAAITLKLSSFEETGGIIAAHTTSIPEAAGSGRNWDYRYCWIRDAYFVVNALNRLGATRTMEEFISFIFNIVSNAGGRGLRPVYSIVPSDPLEERIAEALAGYQGNGPVRVGNAAVHQDQFDTYGSIVLSALPMFFDRRLPKMGDETLFRFLEPIGEKAARLALEPDAGIWEYRGRKRVHTHSAAMCWAGCNRLAAIAEHLGLRDRAAYWDTRAEEIRGPLLERAWSEKRQAFTVAFDSEDLDASCLLLAELGLVEASDPRFAKTVLAIESELFKQNNVMRYVAADDFGLPETAFLICRFWLIDAWWSLGRREEARDLFVDALRHRNRYGLLSEDLHPETGALWGNFPQTYSMAGLIMSAMRLSRSWEDRYWRG